MADMVAEGTAVDMAKVMAIVVAMGAEATAAEDTVGVADMVVVTEEDMADAGTNIADN